MGCTTLEILQAAAATDLISVVAIASDVIVLKHNVTEIITTWTFNYMQDLYCMTVQKPS